MKGFFSVMALPSLFTSIIAAPLASELSLEKRQSADASNVVNDETTAGINADSSALDNATAATSFITNIVAITTAVDAVKAQVDLLQLSSVVRRQIEAALAGLVEKLLLEVSGALNSIVGTLGLTALLGSLDPLVSSLSALLLSLENVVDILLTVVRELLDGLLTGLSVRLAGLVL
ncbi:hypothetical protein LTS10_012583 [Elasticomyces elasticus]|nr:hypothetical protein LTS10_012583 [Elasticomyces elasticus]